jgi:hypothetical protein
MFDTGPEDRDVKINQHDLKHLSLDHLKNLNPALEKVPWNWQKSLKSTFLGAK